MGKESEKAVHISDVAHWIKNRKPFDRNMAKPGKEEDKKVK